jgi:DNA-binding winged helix-turn-helix (wHTH) protein/Tol biopolymer transport system component
MTPGGDRAYEFGPFLLIAAERVLLCQGQRVPLTPKVFETLLILVENAGHIVPKDMLFKRVWPDTIVQEDSLTFNISNLRKILGHYGAGQQFIQTEPKLGYRFVAPVKAILSASPDAETAPSLNSHGIGIGSGASTASLDAREVGRHEGISVRRRVKWAGLGLALLIVVATAVWLATPLPQPKILKYDQITTDGREKRWDLATDGARVYFIEQASTGWVIAQVSASGGEPVPIASTPKDSVITGISPDHRDLLVVEGQEFAPGTLEVIPLLAGEPRRLGNLRVYSASWAPDARTLAYTTEGGVYLCDPDGSNSRRIVTMSGQLNGAHWSPSGGMLCFTRSEPSGDSLWEVDRDGNGLRCMYPGILSGFGGSYGLWTPNGEYLIAQSLCGGHRMPSAVRLSSGPFDRHSGQPACLGFAPLDLDVSAISPDSARLFGLGNAATHLQMEEYGAHAQEFKPFLPDVSAEYADFSRDGQRIAYVTGYEEITGGENLWISQIDGSHKVQITKPPVLVQLPRWSPDGRWIAFMGKDPGKAWRVRVVSVDGGSYAPATPVNDEEGAPTWSPDGNQVAFGGMTQPLERTMGRLVIHILNLKTHQLSNVPGSEGLWTARWSPDGRYIAALTEDSRNLMLFDFRTARWAKLATLGTIPDVVWSRHEEVVYFNGELAAGDSAVFRVKIPSGKVERVASLKGRTERGWLGLTPDDSPLIARYTGAQEIYALAVNWP